MTKCFCCNYDVHPSIGQCPQCGATIGNSAAELERDIRSLLGQGRKLEAVKLYKDRIGVGLAAAKNAVEAMQNGEVPPPETGGGLEAELLRLLGRGEKLEAVKLYKDQKGVGLADAKQAVESLAAKYGLEMRRAGCLGVVAAFVAAAVALGMTIR